jgi:hypothetical protein
MALASARREPDNNSFAMLISIHHLKEIHEEIHKESFEAMVLP